MREKRVVLYRRGRESVTAAARDEDVIARSNWYAQVTLRALSLRSRLWSCR